MAAGDVTYTNKAANLAIGAFASGSLECDASHPINVLCGFQPARIKLFYKDSGATTLDRVFEWFAGMTAANYWNTLMSSGAITLVTSSGPVVFEGDADETEGFTIPAALMDADADTIYWIAYR